MKISIYDTYVPKEDGSLMHFDILIEENDTIENVYKYGREYLNKKNITDYKLSTKECNFCHIETAPAHIEKEVKERGYFILEMENCN